MSGGTTTTTAVPPLSKTTTTSSNTIGGGSSGSSGLSKVSPRVKTVPVESDIGGEVAKNAEKIDVSAWEEAERRKKSGIDIETLRGATSQDNGKFKKVNAQFAVFGQSEVWE